MKGTVQVSSGIQVEYGIDRDGRGWSSTNSFGTKWSQLNREIEKFCQSTR